MARRCRTCFSSEGFWILTTTTPTGIEEAGWEAERARHTQPRAFSVPQMQKLRLACNLGKGVCVGSWRRSQEGGREEGKAGQNSSKKTLAWVVLPHGEAPSQADTAPREDLIVNTQRIYLAAPRHTCAHAHTPSLLVMPSRFLSLPLSYLKCR